MRVPPTGEVMDLFELKRGRWQRGVRCIAFQKVPGFWRNPFVSDDKIDHCSISAFEARCLGSICRKNIMVIDRFPSLSGKFVQIMIEVT